MKLILGSALLFLFLPLSVDAYPFDPVAQEETGIRRLKWQWDVEQKKMRGRRLPQGAQLPLDKVALRMLQHRDFDIGPETPKDPELQEGLEKVLKKWRFKRYRIALLDITDPANPLYAGIDEKTVQTPGSTAKVLVAAGLMQALKDRVGTDVKKRQAFLREQVVQADHWLMPNRHEVPVLYPQKKGYGVVVRKVKMEDQFSLWEWLDHALSPSSNAAATMVWREAILMNLLKEEYPPKERSKSFYKQWPREVFTEAAFSALDRPLLDAGLNIEDAYLRMFFTRGAGRYIKSSSSRASPFGLVRLMLRMEQGRLVDEFSSLELKRLLYLTRRRTRYAFQSALNQSAVYFKSGSLYGCVPEEGFVCGKYRGNSVNVLNGMAIVETPWPPAASPKKAPTSDSAAPAAVNKPLVPGTSSQKIAPQEEVKPASAVRAEKERPQYTYLVAVMSNELKRNASSDHARLAGVIHKLIMKRHRQEKTSRGR